MKLCATSFDPATQVHVARATWPLPEPALAYFPNARSATSDRDLVARAATCRLVLSEPWIHTIEGAAMAPDSEGQDHGHVPVLLDRCVELLTPALTRRDATGAGAVLVDATLGAGGHAERFLTDLPGLRLVGLDRDPNALRIAGERLAPFGDRVTPRPHPLRRVLGRPRGRWTVDGVLFDLGVSSMQLDLAERGFSYSKDAPLDMRMDPDAPLTAAEVLNTFDARELTRILREYGEERLAKRIAGEIVRWRARKPFTTTGELVELLYAAIPAPARRTGGHPAKRTFQALRIAVNAELDSLSDAVPAAMSALSAGGRIVVMAYQSLEDRIVKGLFAAATASRTPSGLPVELPGHEPDFVSLTRGAEKAGDAEVDLNPRSASVRLRALEKVVRREVS